MPKIETWIGQAKTVAIVGHARPDGDCIGSCLGLYHYLKKTMPSVSVQVYLEPVHPKFMLLDGAETIENSAEHITDIDLLFVLDCAEEGRIGAGKNLTAAARRIVCIDHHISNSGFGDDSYVCPDASSTSEVLFWLMKPEYIEKDCAACLYTGIVHDTGVFRHSCTAKSTMEAAGILMEKGADFTRIILETFFQKSLAENRILGSVLEHATLHLGGKVVSGIATIRQMEHYGVTPRNLDGIVDSLNQTEGVVCTVFLYETEPDVYKVSLRSKEPVRVNEVAAVFGGGGHVRAAGCSLSGSTDEILARLLAEIDKQLRK